MSSITAVVIDDEYFNRGLITTLVPRLHAGFSIVGEANNSDEGYQLICSVNPEVVFLDIKMPDGSGFDLLKRFDTIDFEVVFITGFDEYALKELDCSTYDYLLKPIDLEKLALVLERLSLKLTE